MADTVESAGANEGLFCGCGSAWALREGHWTRTGGPGCSFCRKLIPVSRIELRPELRAFAEEMESLLQYHDDRKSGWEIEDPSWLFRRILDEVGEVIEAINPMMGADSKAVIRYILGELMRMSYGTAAMDRKLVRRELIDVANFCMFLHYRLGVPR